MTKLIQLTSNHSFSIQVQKEMPKKTHTNIKLISHKKKKVIQIEMISLNGNSNMFTTHE